jgi:hypothetical protein
MKRWSIIFSCLIVTALAGCATSQVVTLASMNPPKDLHSAALVFQEGNNSDMDIDITQQLRDSGISVKPALPAGVRQAPDIDMLVTYSDKWRWDIVMYLKSLDLNIFDAKSGNLIVTGRWENSAFHGFQDSKKIIKGLLDEMMSKVRDAVSKNQ